MKKLSFLSRLLILSLFCTTAFSCNKVNTEDKNKPQSNVAEVAGSDKDPKEDSTDYVKIRKMDGLTVYFPKASRIDLVCGERPSKNDKEVIMTVAGAFTDRLLDQFDHSNIIGDHVSSGTLYQGTPHKRCTGAFTYYNNIPHFYFQETDKAMRYAVSNKGCAFTQEMLIHEEEIMPHTRPDDNVNEFRALCLLGGRVAVIDSDGNIKFGDFISRLKKIGVREAIYLDMGPGWNYSWYREPNGEVKEIHKYPTPYSTNWLTFYK